MKAIVVVDRNWGIGREGRLLVHLPGDLKYFKERTLGKVLVMGRKTLESMPGGKPLPGRTTIALSRSRQPAAECRVCASMEELMEALAPYDADEIFIAGGGSVYEQFLPLCDTFYVTKIDGEYPADRYFPDLDRMAELGVVWRGGPQEDKGVRYEFFEYKRRKNGNE